MTIVPNRTGRAPRKWSPSQPQSTIGERDHEVLSFRASKSPLQDLKISYLGAQRVPTERYLKPPDRPSLKGGEGRLPQMRDA